MKFHTDLLVMIICDFFTKWPGIVGYRWIWSNEILFEYWNFIAKNLEFYWFMKIPPGNGAPTFENHQVECQGEILEHASVQIKVFEPCHFQRLIELSNDINLTLSIYLWFISRVIHAKMWNVRQKMLNLQNRSFLTTPSFQNTTLNLASDWCNEEVMIAI